MKFSILFTILSGQAFAAIFPFQAFAKDEAPVKPLQTYRIQLSEGSVGAMGDWTFAFEHRPKAKSTLTITNKEVVRWNGGSADESGAPEVVTLSSPETDILRAALLKNYSKFALAQAREYIAAQRKARSRRALSFASFLHLRPALKPFARGTSE